MWMTLKTLSISSLAFGDMCLAVAVSFWPHTSGFASGIVLSTVLCGFLMLFTAISGLTPQLQLLSHSASVHATELFERSGSHSLKSPSGQESTCAIQSPESASTVTQPWLNCSDSIRCLSVTLVGFPQSCPKTGLPSTSVGQRALKIRSRMNAITESKINEQIGYSES